MLKILSCALSLISLKTQYVDFWCEKSDMLIDYFSYLNYFDAAWEEIYQWLGFLRDLRNLLADIFWDVLFWINKLGKMKKTVDWAKGEAEVQLCSRRASANSMGTEMIPTKLYNIKPRNVSPQPSRKQPLGGVFPGRATWFSISMKWFLTLQYCRSAQINYVSGW